MNDGMAFFVRQPPPANPISFDETKCVGCNRCLEACQIDVLLPAEEKGQHPEVAYPDECWYCGCCVMECPMGAIKLTHPLMNQTRWVEKKQLIAGKE
ncbi:MAG: 4Fe-4S binding protein [Eubacteriales bacterium]|nr:4Fe-4S binding protein [Eubacteriales bacterium]MDD3074875.1 4Fe-4S binding protein [Eubacteriales bacterium]MDD4769301.1 4Fe-4S binding protein [Eubacteriales bacterium]